MLTPQSIRECRQQFPALQRQLQGQPVVFLDGPAGTQVPQRVIAAIHDYLTRCNANHGGEFTTSRESDEGLREAHAAVADLLGTDDPGTVAFGPNMTSLTLALSRALAKTWRPGDEVVVTSPGTRCQLHALGACRPRRGSRGAARGDSICRLHLGP